MFVDELPLYRCPKTGEMLKINNASELLGSEIVTGILSAIDGPQYPVSNGIPDFTYPQVLAANDAMTRKEYDVASKDYDKLQNVTFSILCQNESIFRKDMIGLLRLKKNSVVLETAVGTGLNLPYIIDEMGGNGHVYVQDISSGMLKNCLGAVSGNISLREIKIHLSIGNAAYLPFPDDCFDAALSFGGIGVFADKEKAIKEMCRVVKPGGRIVFGDEGVAPWLRNSCYGKILIDNNRFYADEVPLNILPVEARDVTVRWVMGGGFYLVDMTVGEGEPHADFDYQIPGVRGGTLNTRYYGKLEGVTAETKKLIQKAREKSGKSMHLWLDKVLRKAAEKEITG